MATQQPRITRVFGAVNIGSFRVSAMIMGQAERLLLHGSDLLVEPPEVELLKRFAVQQHAPTGGLIPVCGVGRSRRVTRRWRRPRCTTKNTKRCDRDPSLMGGSHSFFALIQTNTVAIRRSIRRGRERLTCIRWITFAIVLLPWPLGPQSAVTVPACAPLWVAGNRDFESPTRRGTIIRSCWPTVGWITSDTT